MNNLPENCVAESEPTVSASAAALNKLSAIFYNAEASAGMASPKPTGSLKDGMSEIRQALEETNLSISRILDILSKEF